MLLRKRRRIDHGSIEAQEWEREFLRTKRADPDMSFESFVKLYEQDIKPKIRLNTWLTKESVIESKLCKAL